MERKLVKLSSSKILGLKPRRSTTALLLNMSIVYEIYAKM
ncbi:hypothetical protein VL20_2136 [Microcystis panniformis FACHB-1757]|uniref:Uncharacterized protein n=1 Tax=Microcystis panniformis FACHB-1757 TaxID=1638788 RepID=A0A0K1RZM3_9CHRO|nr:hypothetical protein VL20_2136 [Microcystis panniformis FACHB-1757]